MENSTQGIRWATTAIFACALLVIGFVGYSASSAQSKEILRIRWLIAHEPVELFHRAKDVFTQEFNARSETDIEIQLLGPKDVGSTKGALLYQAVYEHLRSGDVQLATVATAGVSKLLASELEVLQLPYLFAGPDEIEILFEDPLGEDILGLINTAQPDVRGLAFTFSGGPMVIQSNSISIASAKDFRNKRIGTINGRVAEEALSAFGALPQSIDPNESSSVRHRLDEFDGVETPYSRIFPELGDDPKFITETKHSFFTTLVIASEEFFASLSPKDQEAFMHAAKAAARIEREDSLARAESVRARLAGDGSTIYTLSSADVRMLEDISRSVYDTYVSRHGDALLRAIEDLLAESR